MARSLAQAAGVRALNHDVRAVERREGDAADRMALLQTRAPVACRAREVPAVVEARDRHQMVLGAEVAGRLVQLVPERVLLLLRQERGHRLLPCEGETGVGQHQDSARDEDRGDEVQHRPDAMASPGHD
jgi:hypothetical protein